MKKSLGKGLDSLIRSNNKPDPLSKIDNSELFITDLMPNPNQPRKNFDVDLINDLADSIKEHGLIQPISVIESQLVFSYYTYNQLWLPFFFIILQPHDCFSKNFQHIISFF